MKKLVLNGTITIAIVIIFVMSVNAQNTKNVSRCADNQLSLKEVESEGGMGGRTFGNYVFTNISSTTCTVSGYPRFILLDKAGKVMRGVRVTYDWTSVSGDTETGDSSKPSVVTLEPKQTAWFQISYNNGFGYDLKKPVASSTKVKVTAPGTVKAFVLKSEIDAYKSVKVSALRSGLPQ
jgi:hypothetical protein